MSAESGKNRPTTDTSAVMALMRSAHTTNRGKNIINKIFYFEVFSQKAFLEKIENKNLKTQIKKRLNLFYLLLISTVVLEVISIFTRSFF